MEKSNKVAALYIATLKAMSIVHQHNHWTTKGADFYANHQLFMRIYESSQKNLDTAAEKFIGLLGNTVLNYDFQTDLLSRVLSKYSKLEGSPAAMSLAVEKDFLKLSREAYDCFQQERTMSLGLDDMIMAIASDREESVYLLQQSLTE
jgi:DNA-binding ferritin-like protein